MGSKKSARLDNLLVERGLAEDLRQAQALIMTGDVLVNDVPVTKSGSLIDLSSSVRLRKSVSQFVGRGGDKIDPLFDAFNISLVNRVAIDVGASTGGFTDCMLQRFAKKVYAVDVGTAQLAEKLRQDPRVVVLEKTHAKDLSQIEFPEPPSFATIDVSFTSLRRVLEPVCAVLSESAELLCLVKPQFELEQDEVGKGGVVNELQLQQKAIDLVKQHAESLGLIVKGELPAALKGNKKGNQEYFLYLTRGKIHS